MRCAYPPYDHYWHSAAVARRARAFGEDSCDPVIVAPAKAGAQAGLAAVASALDPRPRLRGDRLSAGMTNPRFFEYTCTAMPLCEALRVLA